jgi:hypothetical protein
MLFSPVSSGRCFAADSIIVLFTPPNFFVFEIVSYFVDFVF